MVMDSWQDLAIRRPRQEFRGRRELFQAVRSLRESDDAST